MKRILIAGYGKMGAWLCSLLKDEYDVAVYETDRRAMGTESDVLFLNDKSEALSFAPDLFLNCVSISNTLSVFTEMDSHLPPACMLADIASVKSGLADYYRNSGRSYVSLHPMFGPTFSDMSSPGGRTSYIITESDIKGKEFFRSCLEKAGILIREVGFIEHDKLMATFLSVPVLTALSFSSAATEVAFAGTTYHRFTGVSAGVMNEDPGLLAMILKNHYTDDRIAEMIKTLGNIAEALDRGLDPEINSLIKSLQEKSGLKSGQ